MFHCAPACREVILYYTQQKKIRHCFSVYDYNFQISIQDSLLMVNMKVFNNKKCPLSIFGECFKTW